MTEVGCETGKQTPCIEAGPIPVDEPARCECVPKILKPWATSNALVAFEAWTQAYCVTELRESATGRAVPETLATLRKQERVSLTLGTEGITHLGVLRE